MADMLYGGGARHLGYRLKVNSGGTGYDIVQADGTTPATAAAHASLILSGYIEQSQYIPDSAGKMKITLDNYDISEEIIDFLNVFATKPATSGGTRPAAITMENGVAQGGGTSNAAQPKILWIGSGPLSESDATLRLAVFGIGQVDMSSGPIVFKDGQWIKPVITINSLPAEFALTVPPALFGALFGAVGTVAVPQYAERQQKYLLAA